MIKDPKDGFDLIEYPLDYTFKAMCHNNASSLGQLEKDIKSLVPGRKIEFSQRQSRTGKYASLSVTVRLQSRDELETIYKEIIDHDGVVMTL